MQEKAKAEGKASMSKIKMKVREVIQEVIDDQLSGWQFSINSSDEKASDISKQVMASLELLELDYKYVVNSMFIEKSETKLNLVGSAKKDPETDFELTVKKQDHPKYMLMVMFHAFAL